MTSVWLTIRNYALMLKMIKKLLPAKMVHWLKHLLVNVRLASVRFFSANGFLASCYYTFFSRQFYREHRAVLLGQLTYQRELKQNVESSWLLRRNIHRLEKGLIMQPRNEIFAEAYISETVDCYVYANQAGCLCADELKWAEDVLTTYFQVVAETKIVSDAKRRFMAATPDLNVVSSVPYPHSVLPACSIDYQQLLLLFRRRRSVRWYLPKPVDMTLIRQAVKAATLAPSACNRQPFRFYVVNDSAKAAEVADCAMGTAGFAQNLPCVIAVVGDLSAYPAERDRHVIYIDGSLAAMQLMLAFETLGLSTCPINWPDIESRERLLSDKLGLAYSERTVMLLAVGYAQPQGGIPFSQKKSDELLIKEV
jgi:nitroreductase